MEAQEIKAVVFMDDTRFLRMEHQLALLEPVLQDWHYRFKRFATAGRDEEVVGIADEAIASDLAVSHLPFPTRLGSRKGFAVLELTQELAHAIEGNIGEKRRDNAALRGTRIGGVKHSCFQISGLQPLPNPFATGTEPNGVENEVMADGIKRTFDIGIENPTVMAFVQANPRLVDSVLGTASGPKPIAMCLKTIFPTGFQGILDEALRHAVKHTRNPQRTLFTVRLGNIYSSGSTHLTGPIGRHLMHQAHPLGGRQRGITINASRLASGIQLGDSSH